MIVLALDCSGDACSVAVLDGDTVRARASETIGRGHAERIAPMISETLAAAGIKAAELELVAATTGPGGFTGVRIGLAAAQGLARAIGVPAVGVSVTEAIALDIPVTTELPLLVAIDSRRADPFGEWFDAAEGSWRGRGPTVLNTNDLEPGGPALVVGSAASVVQERLTEAQPLTDQAPPVPVLADPVAVARIAAEAHARGRSKPAAPMYLRAPDVSAPDRDRGRRDRPGASS